MNVENRVVVTGIGTTTSIGNDVESFWNGLKERKVGIGPITYFDTTDYKAKLAVEVKDFGAKNYMDPRAVRCMEVFSQLTVAASRGALEDSGLDTGKESLFRVGINVGFGIGSPQSMERKHRELLKEGPSRVNPLLVPMMTGSTATGNVAIQFGLEGKCINVVTTCATSTHSIGEALRSIQYGEAETMLAGGMEASVCSIGMAGSTALTALNTTGDLMKASIPFSKERSGFIVGEGAGVVVLEPLEHAGVRGAHIYVEAVGYGTTCDTYHITFPTENGNGATMATTYVIQNVGAAPEDIDYISAHGTSVHHDDLPETKTIKTALGDHAYDVHISSTKFMIGHLLGVTGGVEFITRVESIEEGCVHVTAGLEIDDEECDLNYAKGESVSTPVHYIISNSLDFSRHNTSILVK